ncbi:prolipoprotein diacylglyceryl transferase [Crocinitomix catalasitica]|nr:prolipoprotein diacylglyceryl transferase [Crocinitomix catalasitica]
MILQSIVWNFNPAVTPWADMPRWYGIMWAVGFYIGFILLSRMYRSENVSEKWVDKTFLYVLIGGILGARLGHCLFYEPADYLANPIEILYIWEGGLASHGGTVGIIIAVYFLSKRVTKKPILWTLDRIAVPTVLAACLIRLGNLFNHEIVGKVTESGFGFKFLRHDIGNNEAIVRTSSNTAKDAFDKIANNPDYAHILAEVPARHPAQLYESIAYLLIFFVIWKLYWSTNIRTLNGAMLGVFLSLLFGSRFFLEFFKINQDGNVDQSLEVLNMGQLLSIPFILLGLFLFFRKMKEIAKEKRKVPKRQKSK